MKNKKYFLMIFVLSLHNCTGKTTVHDFPFITTLTLFTSVYILLKIKQYHDFNRRIIRC